MATSETQEAQFLKGSSFCMSLVALAAEKKGGRRRVSRTLKQLPFFPNLPLYSIPYRSRLVGVGRLAGSLAYAEGDKKKERGGISVFVKTTPRSTHGRYHNCYWPRSRHDRV